MNKNLVIEKFDDKFRMPKKTKNPFFKAYNPALDTSPELSQETASYFQSIVGVLGG